MKIKFFSFKAKTTDPRPLDIDASTTLYTVYNGQLKEIKKFEAKDFSFEDITLFDEDFGGTLNISLNDLLHGEYEIRENIADVEEKEGLYIIKRIFFDDRTYSKRGVVLKIEKIENNSTYDAYSENRYHIGSLEERVENIARITGLEKEKVKNLLTLT